MTKKNKIIVKERKVEILSIRIERVNIKFPNSNKKINPYIGVKKYTDQCKASGSRNYIISIATLP